ncbi:hypothetical protein PR202_gn00380 [Eleusine coracana subsp. coracana]|uniref:Peptidase C14 caspase domain-containing protein n=1 Tax=Eleusine coracana subsp. coracana TaxID=191504 RepID=A0AAV5G537_ELECO|nr:hypothetical protein PR202_gn00380 [Eleusine coracana subsp. coracana]
MSSCGGRSRSARCRYCSSSITVAPDACAVQCSQCNGVTRIRRSSSLVIRPPQRPVGFPCHRGNKRAVLIGITYAGMRRGCGQLNGPLNDVKCMRQLLCQRFGFPNECILVLTDDQKDPCRLPTKDNIRMAMHWLVQGCSSGDSLVFHFSGMGAQVCDENGDELDGFDEAICPMDSFQKGPILDDEINDAIVRPLVPGVKLHAIVDACHSAGVLDLSFLCRVCSTGNWQWEDHRPRNGQCKGTSGGQAMLISGFSGGKTQFSVAADSYASVGAMTHSFVKAVQCETHGVTYGRVLTMRNIMVNGGNTCNMPGPCGGAPISKIANFSGVQEPQLSSSEMFDIHRRAFAL